MGRDKMVRNEPVGAASTGWADMLAGAPAHVSGTRGVSRAPQRVVRAGFIPLIDMAVLVAAERQGFARREGLSLELVREVSWSNIRDRLAVRQFDVAHMLSPMPVAAQIGVGSNPTPCFTPFALGGGGNAITLSVALYREMQQLAGLDGTEGALANARALQAVIARRNRDGARPLVLAMTYPFSSHNYELRFWLAAGGINPDRDVTLIVTPPPMTANALASGTIDGFCVNAPWNVIAVESGVGRIVATKADIWPAAPEKVLGVSPAWAGANDETLMRLIVALDMAARWCDVPGNHADLADMLADPACIGAEPEMIRRLLRGELSVDPAGQARRIDSYVTYHSGGANFPWLSQARWIYSQMIRWGQAQWDPARLNNVAAAYRPDIYGAALSGRVQDIPVAASKPEGTTTPTVVATNGGSLKLASQPFLDGRMFDPEDLPGYVRGFPIRS